MKRKDWMIGITATDLVSTAQHAADLGIAPPWPPSTANLDYKTVSGFRPGVDEPSLIRTAKEKLSFEALRAWWSFDPRFDVMQASWLVETFPVVDVHLLSKLSFLFATFGTRFEEWDDYKGPLNHERAGVGRGHWALGWGFALQGAGHRQLVSRRWLDHGPWRVTYGDNDTTLVQFHDLEADAATAREQAREGHELWSNYLSGGFISDRDTFVRIERPTRPVPQNVLYVPDDRSLRVVVHGRPVPEGEMLEAAANRIYPPKDDQPVESIRYVFMDMAQARSYLHPLWLRGIEVYAMTNQGEVRLDDRYSPPAAEKPAWVRHLDAGEVSR